MPENGGCSQPFLVPGTFFVPGTSFACIYTHIDVFRYEIGRGAQRREPRMTAGLATGSFMQLSPRRFGLVTGA